jgi:hypothetical protein
MRRDAVVLIALGAASLAAWLVLGIGFLGHLSGWLVPVGGTLLGGIGGTLFVIGVSKALSRKQV